MSLSLARWGRIGLMLAVVCAAELILLAALVPTLRLDAATVGVAIYVVINFVVLSVVFLAHFQLMQARQVKLVETEAHSLALKTQLEQQARTLDAVLSAAPDLIVLHDEAQRITYLSPSVVAVFGLKLPTVIGKAWNELSISHEVLLHNQAMLTRAYQTKQLVRYESLRAPTTMGQRDFEIILNPMCEPDGRVSAVMLMARDITERKRTEAALVASEERYRVITELISDYAYSYLVEPDGTIISEWITEESFIRLTGYTQAEIDSKGDYALYPPEDRERAKRDVAATIRGETGSGEYHIVTKNGEYRWLRIFRRPLWDEAEGRVTRFFGVAQDITANKRAEEQRLRLSVERERLMTINRFVDAFSHYFRNHLATIESSRYLIERTTADAAIPELPRRLGVIHECIINMRDQLDNLRVVASMTLTTPIACKLNPVVELILSEFGDLAKEKQLNVEIDTSATLPFAWASPHDLQMAVRHLIANAVTYTPEGGKVSVRTCLHNGNPCVEVRDTGMGIAEEQLGAVFELFFKGDPSKNINQGGVGLGLSIVRLIAETYGGSVRVESKVGQGSTFTLELLNAERF